jgi:hypothetical protein
VELPDAGVVEIIEKTEYPYDENVSITINPEKAARFPLKFRIPGWCKEALVTVNGALVEGKPQAGTFFTIEREWKAGDKVDLKLTMPITFEFAEIVEEPPVVDPNHFDPELAKVKQIGLRPVDKPVSKKHMVAVSRGPLVYTLYIKPERIIEPDDHGIEGYIVESVKPASDAAPWNVALILDAQSLEKSLEFTRLDVPAGAPFQYPSVGLKCKAKLVPGWKAKGTPDKPITSVPELPVETSDAIVEVILVPFGCTNIRMTWLPFVLEG